MARYYPGGSRVPGSSGYDPQPLPNDVLENNFVSDWLYSDWDKGKYQTFKMLYSFRPFQMYFDYLLDIRNDEHYMDRFGVEWSDITDPRKLSQTKSSAALYGSVLNFVSENVKRLY